MGEAVSGAADVPSGGAMSEPPKPITRLAEPIDRSGPRGRNRLGGAALQVAVWPWPILLYAGVLLDQLFTAHWPDAKAGAVRVFEVLVVVALPLVLVTAICLAISALVRAANRHLKRGDAIAALVIAGLVFCSWLLLMLRG